jgi:hypothetical protein
MTNRRNLRMSKKRAYIGRYKIENSDLTLIVLTASYGDYRFLYPDGKGLKEVLEYAEKQLGCTHWTPRYGYADPRTEAQKAEAKRHGYTDQPNIAIYPRDYE